MAALLAAVLAEAEGVEEAEAVPLAALEAEGREERLGVRLLLLLARGEPDAAPELLPLLLTLRLLLGVAVPLPAAGEGLREALLQGEALREG